MEFSYQSLVLQDPFEKLMSKDQLRTALFRRKAREDLLRCPHGSSVMANLFGIQREIPNLKRLHGKGERVANTSTFNGGHEYEVVVLFFLE